MKEKSATDEVPQNAGSKVLDFGDAETHLVGPSVQETIDLGMYKLRRNVAIAICVSFLLINAAVMWGIYNALVFDFELIREKVPGYTRFVDATVVGLLLTATTLQLGAIMYAIAQFLFPSGKANPPKR